jgi:uroporphyrinogen decarboxylase
VGKPLLDVLNAKVPSRRPVWLMRQAGRYLPEYRALRAKAGSFLGLCYDPEAATEVTLQPLRRFDLDAAIIFSDILVVPHAMGLGLDFLEGEGPKLQTVSSLEEVRGLSLSSAAWQFDRVCDSLRGVSAGLSPGKTLIGFCGAPWTVASYMIEGGSSGRAKARSVAEDAPDWFVEMIERLIEVSVAYLVRQVQAGAEVVQIFDSWAGDLAEWERHRWVVAPIARMVEMFRKECPGVPVIVFARGVGEFQGIVAKETRANGVSIEQDTSLSSVLHMVPANCAVQGNLSPEVLVEGGSALDDAVRRILAEVPMSRHVFNLGHGIVPQTPIMHVERVLEIIRQHDGAKV